MSIKATVGKVNVPGKLGVLAKAEVTYNGLTLPGFLIMRNREGYRYVSWPEEAKKWRASQEEDEQDVITKAEQAIIDSFRCIFEDDKPELEETKTDKPEVEETEADAPKKARTQYATPYTDAARDRA